MSFDGVLPFGCSGTSRERVRSCSSRSLLSSTSAILYVTRMSAFSTRWRNPASSRVKNLHSCPAFLAVMNILVDVMNILVDTISGNQTSTLLTPRCGTKFLEDFSSDLRTSCLLKSIKVFVTIISGDIRGSTCLPRDSPQCPYWIMRGSAQHVVVLECEHLLELPDGVRSHNAAIFPHHDVFIRPSLLSEAEPVEPALTHRRPLNFSTHSEHHGCDELHHHLVQVLPLHQSLLGRLAIGSNLEFFCTSPHNSTNHANRG